METSIHPQDTRKMTKKLQRRGQKERKVTDIKSKLWKNNNFSYYKGKNNLNISKI